MSDLSSSFSRLLADMKREFTDLGHDIYTWFVRAEDSERLIIMCAFILLLLLFFVKRDTDGKKRSGGIFRQFFGAILFICVFAFATGWVMEARHEYGFLSWLA